MNELVRVMEGLYATVVCQRSLKSHRRKWLKVERSASLPFYISPLRTQQQGAILEAKKILHLTLILALILSFLPSRNVTN
jgi:hypothetical protein